MAKAKKPEWTEQNNHKKSIVDETPFEEKKSREKLYDENIKEEDIKIKELKQEEVDKQEKTEKLEEKKEELEEEKRESEIIENEQQYLQYHNFLYWTDYIYRTIDRKSTRLKSSHTVISYAVFCLKKKKQK